MLLHNQYTNDEIYYYLQIFALLMLIDYIPIDYIPDIMM